MKLLSTLRNQTFLAIVFAGAMAATCAEAFAQAHEKRVGPWVLRGSTVSSETFDETAARTHGIDPGPTRAVLNVTLSRASDEPRANLRADVEASITDLAGRSIDVPMREVVGNGMVSYLGTVDFAPRQVLDFRIVARPHPDGAPITLEFRDRMWVP